MVIRYMTLQLIGQITKVDRVLAFAQGLEVSSSPRLQNGSNSRERYRILNGLKGNRGGGTETAGITGGQM